MVKCSKCGNGIAQKSPWLSPPVTCVECCGKELASTCRHHNASYYGDTYPLTYRCNDCGTFFAR